MRVIKIFYALFFLTFLSGCTTNPVSHFYNDHKDPIAKLKVAIFEYEFKNNPQLADRLIQEAVETCKLNQDDFCSSSAYLEYGLFLKSEIVGEIYQSKDFYDTRVNYSTRYEYAVWYLQEAFNRFKALDRKDYLPDILVQIASAYEAQGKITKACAAFLSSSYYFKMYAEEDVTAVYLVPDGFFSYDAYLGSLMLNAGCQSVFNTSSMQP